MKTVYKYNLNSVGAVGIAAPKGAHPLSVAAQFRDNLCVWMTVDPDAPLVRHEFYIVGTGFEVPPGFTQFIGTVLLEEGRLVLHVFYKPHPMQCAVPQ